MKTEYAKLIDGAESNAKRGKWSLFAVLLFSLLGIGVYVGKTAYGSNISESEVGALEGKLNWSVFDIPWRKFAPARPACSTFNNNPEQCHEATACIWNQQVGKSNQPKCTAIYYKAPDLTGCNAVTGCLSQIWNSWYCHQDPDAWPSFKLGQNLNQARDEIPNFGRISAMEGGCKVCTNLFKEYLIPHTDGKGGYTPIRIKADEPSCSFCHLAFDKTQAQAACAAATGCEWKNLGDKWGEQCVPLRSEHN